MNLTPQQLRDRADAIEAYEAGRPTEYYNETCEQWRPTASTPSMWLYNVHIRPAPAPEPPKPWGFNSRPMEPVWVFKKGYITDCLITAWGDDGVVVSTKHGPEFVRYENLFQNWVRRDGSICGTEAK